MHRGRNKPSSSSSFSSLAASSSSMSLNCIRLTAYEQHERRQQQQRRHHDNSGSSINNHDNSLQGHRRQHHRLHTEALDLRVFGKEKKVSSNACRASIQFQPSSSLAGLNSSIAMDSKRPTAVGRCLHWLAADAGTEVAIAVPLRQTTYGHSKSQPPKSRPRTNRWQLHSDSKQRPLICRHRSWLIRGGSTTKRRRQLAPLIMPLLYVLLVFNVIVQIFCLPMTTLTTTTSTAPPPDIQLAGSIATSGPTTKTQEAITRDQNEQPTASQNTTTTRHGQLIFGGNLIASTTTPRPFRARNEFASRSAPHHSTINSNSIRSNGERIQDNVVVDEVDEDEDGDEDNLQTSRRNDNHLEANQNNEHSGRGEASDKTSSDAYDHYSVIINDDYNNDDDVLTASFAHQIEPWLDNHATSFGQLPAALRRGRFDSVISARHSSSSDDDDATSGDILSSSSSSSSRTNDDNRRRRSPSGDDDDDDNDRSRTTDARSIPNDQNSTTTSRGTRFKENEKVSRVLDELKQKYVLNRPINNTAYYMILSIYGIFSLFGALSNSIICLTVILKPKILSPRNIFILNLASSDLLLCIFTMPFSFIEISTKTWPMGELPCKLVSSLQATSIFVSTISITAIALDRYRVIVYSTHQESNRMSGLTGAFIVLSVWCAALILALPLFLTRQLRKTFMPDDLYDVLRIKKEEFTFCYEEWPFVHGRGIYSVVSMFIQYVVPITIVSIVYVKISDKLQKRLIRRQRLTQMECQQKRQLQLINRTHNMLITVSLVFGLCWLPLNLLNVIVDFTDFLTNDENVFRTVFAICHLIGCFSACSNPILYGYMNENFRKEVILVYSQQWQKLTRYLCRFRRRNSRSTRCTAATTTTTTTTTTTSSTSASCSSSSGSDDLMSTDEESTCSTINKPNGSSCSSQASCSSDVTSNHQFSKHLCSIASQSSRVCSCDQDSQTSHNTQRFAGARSTVQCNSSNDCSKQKQHQKPEVGEQLSDTPQITIQMNENHQSFPGAKDRSTERRPFVGRRAWFGRVFRVRNVWFNVGSMTSATDMNDDNSRDKYLLETTSTPKSALNNCIGDAAGSEYGGKKLAQNGSIGQYSTNNTAENINDSEKAKKQIETKSCQQQQSKKHGNRKHRRRHEEAPPSGVKKKKSQTKKPKHRRHQKHKTSTRCLCHCHRVGQKQQSGRLEVSGVGKSGNKNIGQNHHLPVDDMIMRTCSTGTRPEIADKVCAEVRLAEATGGQLNHINPMTKLQELDHHQQRRRSSTDVNRALINLNRFKTFCVGGAKQQLRSQRQTDVMNAPIGQRVWLRFFPSMQRYCFNQASIAQQQNNLPTKIRMKPEMEILPKHCSICKPSADRRKAERKEQRRFKRQWICEQANKMTGNDVAADSIPIRAQENDCTIREENNCMDNCSNDGEQLNVIQQEKKQHRLSSSSARSGFKKGSTNLELTQETSLPMQSISGNLCCSDEQQVNLSTNCKQLIDQCHDSADCDDLMMQSSSSHSMSITLDRNHSSNIDHANKARLDKDTSRATHCHMINCCRANVNNHHMSRMDSEYVIESDATRKESIASLGSKSWGASSISSCNSCNQTSISYSTCSCFANSSDRCQASSTGCVEPIPSGQDMQEQSTVDKT